MLKVYDANCCICYARWIDNSVVTFVSSYHDPQEFIESDRKRPRKTETNKHHIKTVWGRNARVKIPIPKVTDDYNHYMLAIDLFDQLVSYYKPLMRVTRTWMPHFVHLLNTMHVNGYIAHKHLREERGERPVPHKQYVLNLVQSLLDRAKHADQSRPNLRRRPGDDDDDPRTPQPPARRGGSSQGVVAEDQANQ